MMGQPVEEGRGPPCRPRRSAARRAGSGEHAAPPWTTMATPQVPLFGSERGFREFRRGLDQPAQDAGRPIDALDRARSRQAEPRRFGDRACCGRRKDRARQQPDAGLPGPLTKASPRQGGGSFSQACGTPGAPSSSSGPKNPASMACRRASSSRCSAMIVSSRPSSISSCAGKDRRCPDSRSRRPGRRRRAWRSRPACTPAPAALYQSALHNP
jgi:hypothetical protein